MPALSIWARSGRLESRRLAISWRGDALMRGIASADRGPSISAQKASKRRAYNHARQSCMLKV